MAPPKPTVAPEPVPVELDITPANLDLDWSGEVEHSQSDILLEPAPRSPQSALDTAGSAPSPFCPNCRGALGPGARICVQCGLDLRTGKGIDSEVVSTAAGPSAYAGDQRLVEKHKPFADTTGQPKRGFWRDLVFAFVYPFASGGNALNMLVVLALKAVSPFICMFTILIDFWMCSVCLNVVSDTSAGTDEFRGPTIEGGLYEAIFKPFLAFVGAFVLAMLPSFIYGALVLAGVMPANPVIAAVWTAFGLFLLPMFLLVASLSLWGTILRPHLLLLTVARTILPYLAIWLALGVAAAIYLTTFAAGAVLVKYGIHATPLLPQYLGVVGSRVVGNLLFVYLMIASMRIVGLYYLHYKHRFAFELE